MKANKRETFHSNLIVELLSFLFPTVQYAFFVQVLIPSYIHIYFAKKMFSTYTLNEHTYKIRVESMVLYGKGTIKLNRRRSVHIRVTCMNTRTFTQEHRTLRILLIIIYMRRDEGKK